MGEVHTLSNDFPVLGKFDRFLNRAELIQRHFYAAHDLQHGSIKAQRAWLQKDDEIASLIQSATRDLAMLQRQATRAEIVDALMLLEGMPTGAKGTTTANANRLLAQRVGAREPSYGAINIATLDVLDTDDWHPSPAKMVSALDRANRKLASINTSLVLMNSSRNNIRVALAEAEQQQAFESQRRAERIAYHLSQQEVSG